jgi:hypothetical protein
LLAVEEWGQGERFFRGAVEKVEILSMPVGCAIFPG